MPSSSSLSCHHAQEKRLRSACWKAGNRKEGDVCRHLGSKYDVGDVGDDSDSRGHEIIHDDMIMNIIIYERGLS